MSNVDDKTVSGFGYQWKTYTQNNMEHQEYDELFTRYFKIFPFEKLPKESKGFDMGCGTGRWAKGVVPNVGELYCIDPSPDALGVAKENLSSFSNVQFINSGVNEVTLEDNSFDFGYSLGVLHHIPNTLEGIKKCADLIKPGGFFLIYLYYSLDNKPAWFRAIWKMSNILRKGISIMPNKLKLMVTFILALLVYFPLARVSLILEKMGMSVENIPLSAYRDKSFYCMKTDSFDRFATRLEHRFSKVEIEQMMSEAGFKNIQFSDEVPYWVAIGQK